MQNNFFTEEQAIQITIDNGYDGSEFETTVWKNRGCLKPDRTFEGLISKLKTIYQKVDVEGKGKKRRYLLQDKKGKVEVRKFNYKGSVASKEDEIMKEYIFNSLHNKSDFTQSYKGWASLLKFPDTEKISIEDMINKIKNIHHGFPRIYNPKEAVSKFIQTINIRNKDVIEKSFKRLVKEGRIKVSEIYNFKTIDSGYEEVTQLEYEDAIDKLNKFLESKNVTYYSYSQSVASFYKTRKMKGIIQQVDDYLSEYLEIEYFFKSIKVEVLNDEVIQDVTPGEFNEAYVKRLVKLTTDRQNKNDYKESVYFWKRFYQLNTLSLLKHIGFFGFEETLKKEKESQFEKTEKFDLDLMIHNFERDWTEENVRKSFGSKVI